MTWSGLSVRSASRTWKVWLRSGVPYGMLRHSGSMPSIGCQIDQIAASVAPPRLISSGAPEETARTLPGRLSGIQSPLSSAVRSDRGKAVPCCSQCSTSSSSSGGTVFHSVTRCSSARAAQRPGSRDSEGAGRTSVPPAPSTPKTS